MELKKRECGFGVLQVAKRTRLFFFFFGEGGVLWVSQFLQIVKRGGGAVGG